MMKCCPLTFDAHDNLSESEQNAPVNLFIRAAWFGEKVMLQVICNYCRQYCDRINKCYHGMLDYEEKTD